MEIIRLTLKGDDSKVEVNLHRLVAFLVYCMLLTRLHDVVLSACDSSPLLIAPRY
jgi:hypothetical protein